LQRQVGPLRLGLEFTRLCDAAHNLVRTNWARRAIPKLADALLRHGTLDAEQVNDVLLLA
jgi:hypothetical protein